MRGQDCRLGIAAARAKRELDRQTEILRERAGELEIGRAELRKELSGLSKREAELDAAERQLGYRQQEIETALARYERLGVTEEKMQQLQEEARKFAARRRYLDEAEAQLAQEKADLTDRIRELANQRRQLEEQVVRERRSVATQQQLAETDLQHRRSNWNSVKRRSMRAKTRSPSYKPSCGRRSAKFWRCVWRRRKLGRSCRASGARQA